MVCVDFVWTPTFDGHFLLLVVEVWRFCTRGWGDFVGTLTFDGHFLLLVVEVWRFCTRRERVRRHGNTVSHHSLQ